MKQLITLTSTDGKLTTTVKTDSWGRITSSQLKRARKALGGVSNADARIQEVELINLGINGLRYKIA